MGMFDSVWTRCPRCGASNELQSKNGPRILENYYLDEAPFDVLAGISNEFWCVECDAHLEVVIPSPRPYVRVYKEDDNE